MSSSDKEMQSPMGKCNITGWSPTFNEIIQQLSTKLFTADRETFINYYLQTKKLGLRIAKNSNEEIQNKKQSQQKKLQLCGFNQIDVRFKIH